MPHEHDLFLIPVQRVDDLDDCVDVVTQGDGRAVHVFRRHARQREPMHTMARLLQGRHHFIPGRAVEPETRDQDNIHPSC